eukprot:4913108-Pyramimonas_sp.AAC.1
MRLVPPRSAAAIRDVPWRRDPSLIHAPLSHACDRLTHVNDLPDLVSPNPDLLTRSRRAALSVFGLQGALTGRRDHHINDPDRNSTL